MSTRGVIGLRYNGVDKISYNHFDSYLSQLGLHFLKALRGRNRQDLVEAYARMQLVGNETPPTPEQVETCRRYVEIPAASGASVALVKRIPLTDVLEGRFGEAELLAFDKQLHPEVRGGRSTGV